MPSYTLALDQGTTSSRAVLYDAQGHPVASAQQEFPQHYPRDGWVEHDPDDLWRTTLHTARTALAKAHAQPGELAGIGIANQRETTLLWERATGRPVHPAIVWQDRRTAAFCERLKAQGYEADVTARTGLLLDPYFSGSKLAWLLEQVPGARTAAERGGLAFGTVDTWLLWKLTGGAVHATDATNASRTLLFDIHQGDWSEELLRQFAIPRAVLPEVRDSAADFGQTLPEHFGAAVPIRAVLGDQQAATVGQACFEPGMIKSTYGTGCFAVLNTGASAVHSTQRLLTTIAYQLQGRRTYALEGAIFVAGAAVQWLRDELGLLRDAAQSGELAAQADESQNVYLVPAFVGLGAPWWDAQARGALYGLTRGTGPRELARAALESVCYQTADLLDAMWRDWTPPVPAGGAVRVLRVDGGMAASDWTMQRLADLLNQPVERPHAIETTALGAAYFAGMHAGLYPAPEAFARTWAAERRFVPDMEPEARAAKLRGWRDAVRRTLTER